MNIEIRRLTPDLAEDYARFFDVTPHNVNTDGGKCYCVTWRSDNSYVGNGDRWFPSCEERRERAIHFVRSGSLQGYLAYCGDEIVGWCNANVRSMAEAAMAKEMKSWAGAMQTRIVSSVLIICVLIGP